MAYHATGAVTIVPADNRYGKPNHDWLAKSRGGIKRALTQHASPDELRRDSLWWLEVVL